jgi:hypothetical protein
MFKKDIFNNFFCTLWNFFGTDELAAQRTAHCLEGRLFRADSMEGSYGNTLKDNLPVIFKSSRYTTAVMAAGNKNKNEKNKKEMA